jgi:2-keto-4-pentenoate hydratase/2-oxohepta-3-ene-1,7-dioic acid hydratase in catechol pathway
MGLCLIFFPDFTYNKACQILSHQEIRMKLVTYKHNGQISLGILRTTAGEKVEVINISQLDSRLPTDMIAFLQAGPQAVAQANKALASLAPGVGLDLTSVTLLAPIPNPGKIICIGQNYLEHAKESGASKSALPIIFAKYTNSIIGSGEPIVIPASVKKPDYEGELGVVIGRTGRNIAEDEALTYIAGYLPLNDVSARDWQHRTSQWVIGKTCDTFCPIGPALVTADEIPDPQNLHLKTVINGEVLQSGYTGDMIFSIANLIADMSQVMTLSPGDIIATGTPPGVGAARTPPRWLVPGDIVRVEIERVGVLENPVSAGI